ncbi:hypothetical protein AALO_G00046010 [Alosa alosa]|uniref:Aryl hydrocarbon receptor 2 n=1 Tax=Alosa alosa TaxID=278164 RepID=A0AAV6HD44_9TELE|nr:hypothetical protein AALO_G00046010 [Alosa alosa]
MLGNDGTYAGKKRKKPVQKIKPRPENAKTNPSKRHRDRLNGELDNLTSLLPFPDEVRSRLDKLSVLRLSVAYINVKNFFNATMKNNPALPVKNGLGTNGVDTTNFSEADLMLQALNGIVLVVTSEGYVFYASPTIQDYLGFHQSDVLHQSVFELIHTEDRAMFRRQLHFALNPQPFSQDQGGDDMQNSSDITWNIMTYDPQDIPPENSSFLERTFVCRMRCLLDNSSGFLAFNFQGRLKFLHGQGAGFGNGTSARPQLALFAVARPVQSPSILEVRSKMVIFQTKHKLDFTPMGIDSSRGMVVLGYTEMEICMRGSGYQFIHAADMMHCADNHVRMMKTGESGNTVFRLLSKKTGWVWVQANAKLIYKDGRPDFIIARQRVLLNEEGEEHVRQRKFQLPFSFTSGEALLYESRPSLDIAEICDTGKAAKIRKVFEDNEVPPDSLLGCFYKQNHTAYMQSDIESQFSMEKVYMETRALVNVPSNSWQGEAPDTKDATLAAMLETFDQVAGDSDLGSALQEMDIGNSELKDWENALLRLAKTKNDVDSSMSLDDILTEDILSYLEETLLKESPERHLAHPQNCAAPENGVEISKFHMGQRTNFRSSCVNGASTLPTDLRSAQQGLGALDSAITDIQIELPKNDAIPSLQDLQLYDIFQKLQGSNGLQQNGSATFSLWENTLQVGISNGVSLVSSASTGSFVKPNGCSLSPQNHHALSNCKTNHISSVQNFPQCHPHVGMPIDPSGHVPVDRKRNVAMDQRNPAVLSAPGTNFTTQQMNNRNSFGPNAHPIGCIPNNVSTPFQNSTCQSPQSAPQHSRLNGLSAESQSHGQWAPNSQNSPTESFLNFVKEKYHLEPTLGLANREHSSPSSCMFQASSPPSASLSQLPHGQATAISSPWKTVNHDHQSPPQGSCYIQWSPSKPVVGTASIPQDHACISPPACQVTSGVSTSDMILQYLNCNEQTQIQCTESSPLPPLACVSETKPPHCYNF